MPVSAPPDQSEKKASYTLKDHKEHLSRLIACMEMSTTESMNDDEKSAQQQLDFAIEVRDKLDEMINTSKLNVKKQIKLGIEMSHLPKTYFGEDRIPIIKGDKSKLNASKIAAHYRDFANIHFDELEINISKTLFPWGVPSIKAQAALYTKLANHIDKNINEYNREKPALKK